MIITEIKGILSQGLRVWMSTSVGMNWTEWSPFHVMQTKTHRHFVTAEGAFIVQTKLSDHNSIAMSSIIQPHAHVLLTSVTRGRTVVNLLIEVKVEGVLANLQKELKKGTCRYIRRRKESTWSRTSKRSKHQKLSKLNERSRQHQMSKNKQCYQN